MIFDLENMKMVTNDEQCFARAKIHISEIFNTTQYFLETVESIKPKEAALRGVLQPIEMTQDVPPWPC